MRYKRGDEEKKCHLLETKSNVREMCNQTEYTDAKDDCSVSLKSFVHSVVTLSVLLLLCSLPLVPLDSHDNCPSES